MKELVYKRAGTSSVPDDVTMYCRLVSRLIELDVGLTVRESLQIMVQCGTS